jgi:hypothetical protein
VPELRRCTHAYAIRSTASGSAPYVLEEGFNSEFLGYFFEDTKGHLYDGGFCNEIDCGPIEVDQGDPDEKVRLTELIGATKEPNPASRLARMDRILDIDAYFRHLALEQILCHWDGYSFNRNTLPVLRGPLVRKIHLHAPRHGPGLRRQPLVLHAAAGRARP